MKTIPHTCILFISLLCLISTAFGKDAIIADQFVISLPDTAAERAPKPDALPMANLPRYGDETFYLSIYRWPRVKPADPLKDVPAQWAKNKDWVTISEVSEGKTDSGIPYVTFRALIVRDDRPPYDSVMTVLRAANGEAFMFQISGEAKVIDAIRRSIRNK